MDWLVEALEPLPETDERPAEAVVATGDPAVGVRAAGVLAGTGVPPAALVTACPAELAAEVAAEVADEVRLLAVWTSDCVELDAVLVTLCTAEEAAPVAVPAALETVEAAVEVTEDAVELTLEVTLETCAGVTEGRAEAALIEAPMPMAASSATVSAAATMNERPGIRTSGRLDRSICRNNVMGRGNFRLSCPSGVTAKR